MNVKKFVYAVVAVLIGLVVVLAALNGPKQPPIVPVQLHCTVPGEISTCVEVNEIRCTTGATCGFSFRFADQVQFQEVLWNLDVHDSRFSLEDYNTLPNGVPWYTGMFAEGGEYEAYVTVARPVPDTSYAEILASAKFRVIVDD